MKKNKNVFEMSKNELLAIGGMLYKLADGNGFKRGVKVGKEVLKDSKIVSDALKAFGNK